MLDAQWEADVFDDATLQGIRDLEALFTDFRIPLEASAKRAAQSIGEGLERGGLPDPFAPLAPSTLYQTAHYRIGGPLLRTGLMEEAATDTTGSVPGSAYAVSEDVATVGLDDTTDLGKIGLWLTNGVPENHLPARPFVRVLDSDIEYMETEFEDYIDSAVMQAFSAAGGRI